MLVLFRSHLQLWYHVIAQLFLTAQACSKWVKKKLYNLTPIWTRIPNSNQHSTPKEWCKTKKCNSKKLPEFLKTDRHKIINEIIKLCTGFVLNSILLTCTYNSKSNRFNASGGGKEMWIGKKKKSILLPCCRNKMSKIIPFQPN